VSDYDTPDPEGTLGTLRRIIEDMQRDIREIGRPSGTQTAGAVKKLQDLVDGLIAQTEVNVSGSVTAGGNVSAGGTGTFNAGITSAGVFALDVSTLPGTRRTEWVNINGQLGYAPSTIVRKHIVEKYMGRAADFLACQPVVYEYLGQLAIRDDPENPYFDPTYQVPTEVAHIAEWLIENHLSEFVFFEEDNTTPAGINYAEFAAVGFVVVGRDHEERIARLERLMA
jgi:hypothetical protein